MINQSAVVRAFRRLGSTGILLLALSAGTLGSQAVSTAQGLQVGSPWPTFHQNNLHTGVGGGSGAPGTLKWDFEGQQMSGSSPAIAADGTIYIGGVENALFAIKPANGRPKWTFNPGYGVSSSPAIGADGTIYIGAGDTAVGGAICAVNPADGSLKWKTTTSSIEYSSPAIGTDGTIYVGGSGGVYALNPADGSQKWFFPSQYATYPVESSPAIGPDGTIYVGADDSNVYAINPVDGSQKWKFTTGGEVLSSPAIGADGTIYVGSEDNNVYALNPVNGSEKWEFVTGNEVVSSPAIGADGTVYVGSDDNNVYALNPADGSQKWMFTTGDQVCSSPAIGADGTIYISSCDSNLYAIDPADGSEEWHYTFPSPVYTSIGLLISSPAIGADGTLYLGSTGFDFCAIGRPVVSVVVTSSSNPAAPGQPVTLTATVSPVAPAMGMPTGTVTFMDGLGGVGTEALSNGVATLTPGLSAGSHSITASYSGDSNFPAYTSAVLTQVVLSAPLSGANVALTSSPNPSLPGQSVTLTATVSPVAPATGTPTGTVTFLDGTTTLETQALTNGVATFPTSTLTAGSHSITASYSGDNSFGAALSAPVTQVVIGPPSVSLTSSLNPSQPGLAVTFNVTVATVAPARGTPTGTVTFLDGTTTLGTQTLTNGVAALSTSTLTPGDHSITASYSGDTNFTAATSGALVQVVEGAVLTLSSSANPSVVGQSVTITVTASAVPITAGTPTGTVTFLDGTTILGTQALSNGQAAFSNSTLTAGTHSISASYSGDSTFAATRSMALTQIVTGIAIALTSSADPSLSGQSVTFTAAVSPVPAGTGTPTGTVTFLDGTTTLGTQTIGNGSTAFTASILSPGTHLITASYSGDSNYGPTSGTLIQQVGSAGIPWTWGSNSDGQLGNNSTSDSSVPVPISSLTGVTAVAGGDDSTLALQIGGAVWAWGSNTGGKLGNGTENDCSVPSQVKDPTGSSYFTGAVAVAEGDSHSLALKSDGTVWAWGFNCYGHLGNNCTV